MLRRKPLPLPYLIYTVSLSGDIGEAFYQSYCGPLIDPSEINYNSQRKHTNGARFVKVYISGLVVVFTVSVHVCMGSTVCDIQIHMDVIYHLTLKLGMVRGLVGDGVEDLVDLGVEIWLLETPFTIWRKTERSYTRAGEGVIPIVSTTVNKLYKV